MVTAETSPCANADAMFYSCEKSISRKEKSGSFHWEISVSCINQEYNNVTTPYYPMSSLLSVKWSLMGGKKQKKISKFYVDVIKFLLSNGVDLYARDFSGQTPFLHVCRGNTREALEFLTRGEHVFMILGSLRNHDGNGNRTSLHERIKSQCP